MLLIIGMTSCLAAAVTDLRYGRIPNALTYPLLLGSPLLHLGLALARGLGLTEALLQASFSLLGALACGAIPFVLWRKRAMGGGDVKLFAGLGGLMLPRLGFEAQLYVFLVASLLAPVKLAYDGKLLSSLGNMLSQLWNVFRAKEARRPLAPQMVSWFRLGPCFALGFLVQVLMHWRAP